MSRPTKAARCPRRTALRRTRGGRGVARSHSARVSTAEAEFAEIVAWYEDLLERTYPPTELVWEPLRIGPTWQYDAGWSLPAVTLGWRILAWCGVWLRDKTGKPWQFTPEQTR